MNGNEVSLTFGNPDSATEPVAELKAGVPYIIKWESGDNVVEPVFNCVIITGTTEAQRTIEKADGLVKFIGYYDAFGIDTPANDDIYYMTADNKLKHTAKPRTLYACRAYFQFSAGVEPSTRLTLDFGDGSNETTDINAVEDSSSSTLPASRSAWFTVDGRKLSQQPSRKGVYIYNGNKIVIK